MDLFAGSVNRENASDVLWVCDRCFKYMTDGTSWEVHMVCSGSPLSQATEEAMLTCMAWAVGHRGNVRASIHLAGRCISGVRTRFGKWTARRKKCARTGRLSRQTSFLTPREQLYCQNLSLFGKLFIDIKTLFFDCDNCERLCHRRLRTLLYVFEQSYFISSPTPTPNGIMSSVSFQR